LHMQDEANDQLAFYIPAEFEPYAMAGEVPALTRYYLAKVNKSIKNSLISNDDFTQFVEATKKQNNAQIESIQSTMADTLAKNSEGISKEFNIDFAMKIAKMVPLEAHYEGENGFSYSMYINLDTSTANGDEQKAIAATATFVNVSGKLIFLYCYGTRDDLEWTRRASTSWMQTILANNAPPPERTASFSMNWDSVIQGGVIGGILGGLFTLFTLVRSKLKKKKQG
ncbi:MAG: hypothetical protein MJK04_03965, partial [Psychrosphaera sp.]|nr:hypothetical protein [Psychrosphaera sp.]